MKIIMGTEKSTCNCLYLEPYQSLFIQKLSNGYQHMISSIIPCLVGAKFAALDASL